ncbi:MAG TPA: hypothetical protein VFS17_02485 [Methylophilaceae bacterium]|nr:hypothetical protein [Methylophilaceae bacterium]
MEKHRAGTPERRVNHSIGEAVREGSLADAADFHDTLNTLSGRGVPKVVIERIFVYRQCCRSTDGAKGK